MFSSNRSVTKCDVFWINFKIIFYKCVVCVLMVCAGNAGDSLFIYTDMLCRWTTATQCQRQITSSRSCACARSVQRSLAFTTTTVVLLTTLVANCTLVSSHWDRSSLICRFLLFVFLAALFTFLFCVFDVVRYLTVMLIVHVPTRCACSVDAVVLTWLWLDMIKLYTDIGKYVCITTDQL